MTHTTIDPSRGCHTRCKDHQSDDQPKGYATFRRWLWYQQYWIDGRQRLCQFRIDHCHGSDCNGFHGYICCTFIVRIAMVAGICIGVRINDNIGNHCMIICATVHPPVHRIGYIHVLFMCDDGSCMGVGRRASLMCIDYVTHQWQCCVSGW